MPKDPQEFADLLGAKVVGEVPDVGVGPFGMARLARLIHERLIHGNDIPFDILVERPFLKEGGGGGI